MDVSGNHITGAVIKLLPGSLVASPLGARANDSSIFPYKARIVNELCTISLFVIYVTIKLTVYYVFPFTAVFFGHDSLIYFVVYLCFYTRRNKLIEKHLKWLIHVHVIRFHIMVLIHRHFKYEFEYFYGRRSDMVILPIWKWVWYVTIPLANYM